MNVIEIQSFGGQTIVEFDQNVDTEITIGELMDFVPVECDMVIESIDGPIVTLAR